MAEVQDIVEDVESEEIETVPAKDEGVQESAAQQDASPSVIDDQVPDEFRGKSVKEIVAIAQHARREMGRQANELGEVRKLADELIKSSLHAKPVEQETQDEVDFFENPKEAIRRAVENNPKVQAAEQYALQAQRAMAKQKFEQAHPDAQSIIAEDGFREFINASPIRLQLLRQADAYNFDAAHELFSTYKALKGVRQQPTEVPETEKASRKQSMTAAAVDTGGSGETSKKIYRRTDLMKLMQRDRERYEAMQDEIMLAYREGRVR